MSHTVKGRAPRPSSRAGTPGSPLFRSRQHQCYIVGLFVVADPVGHGGDDNLVMRSGGKWRFARTSQVLALTRILVLGNDGAGVTIGLSRHTDAGGDERSKSIPQKGRE